MLQMYNLQKAFNKDTSDEAVLFKNLTLEVKQGDFITVIGSNGAGKSTLLNIISGNIGFDGGSLLLDSRDISKLPEYKRTKFIGRVFQNPSSGVAPSMTVLENLAMAENKGRLFNLSLGVTKKDREFFYELLKDCRLGIEEKLEVKAGMLSGGQRQALSLVMAAVAKPSLLLLDEHTAALDPTMSAKVMMLTKQIVEKDSITTLMVTHDIDQAINYGNRLIMLHRGEVILDVCGDEKKRLTVEEILKYFKKIDDSGAISDRVIFS